MVVGTTLLGNALQSHRLRSSTYTEVSSFDVPYSPYVSSAQELSDDLNLVDIGKEFGDRDHTTVLHSLDKVEKQMRSDPAFAETVKQITTNINTNPG